jgi:PDZ domain-containing protein
MINKPANLNVYSTGEISPDGSVGAVGAVYEKSLAAAQNGAKIILLPKSETTVQITSDGLVTNSRTVSVQDELGKLYNVTVVGVTNVDETLPYYFS